MNTTKKIIECLDNQLKEYKQPVTILSKTDENDFIIDDTVMFDWDEISKLYGDGDESSSVDAIYCYVENNELTLYLFEFKNQNLHDPFFDAKKELKNIITKLEKSKSCYEYSEEIKNIRKKFRTLTGVFNQILYRINNWMENRKKSTNFLTEPIKLK